MLFLNLQAGLPPQARPQTFGFALTLKTGWWCVPQAIVSHREDNFEFSEAFRFFIIRLLSHLNN